MKFCEAAASFLSLYCFLIEEDQKQESRNTTIKILIYLIKDDILKALVYDFPNFMEQKNCKKL